MYRKISIQVLGVGSLRFKHTDTMGYYGVRM